MSGVYMDMFEQSILLDHAGKHNPGAFAASLLAQILLAGVLIVGPLVFRHALPQVHFTTFIPVRMHDVPPATQPVKSASVVQKSGLSLPSRISRPFVFRPQASSQVLADRGPGEIPALPILGDAGPGGVAAVTIPSSTDVVGLRTQPPADEAAAVQKPEKPVAVSGGVQAAKLVKKIIPVYPQKARELRVSGIVHLLGIIAKDGTLRKLQVVSGNPWLTKAAVDAVSQWVYSPTLLGGQPVEVEAPIDVVFTLQ